MKFRAFILLACMLVVPGMAMFSHRLPTEVRAGLRRHLFDPVHRAMHSVARTLAFTRPAVPPEESPFLAVSSPADRPAPPQSDAPPQPTPPGPDSVRPLPLPGPTTPARVVMPTVTVAPTNAIAVPVAPEGNGLAVPITTSRAAARSFSTPPGIQRPSPPASAAGGIEPPPEPSAEPFPRPVPAEPTPPRDSSAPPLAPVVERRDTPPAVAAIQSKLTSLGAFAIDCQPLAGSTAGYASSCRLNVDPNGELHRMFYGTGPDAAAALRALVDQVEDWQRRQSSAAAARL